MAKLLFRLNGVFEEEANYVREALDNAGIEYYETNQGRWGISVAAIWLPNEDDYIAARELLDQVQEEWIEHVQGDYVPTFAERFRERPTAFILTILAVIAMIGLTVVPFVGVFE
jgi:hypothetical protein